MCAVARCRFRAGAGLCAQGQHAEALASFEEAAALRARVLGEGHQETRGTLAAVARCRIALGTGLTRRGQHKEALASFEDALRVREQALGEGSGDIADAHHAVGLARYQLGVSGEGGQAAEGAEDEGRGSDRRTRYPERALESFARVLLIRSCAEEGERVADTHYCVRLVRLGLKRGAEALNSLKEALRIRRQVCQAIGEEEGEGVAAALSGIGSAYSLLGQPQSALTSCTEALRIRRRVHRGAEGMHARVADAHYNVGLAQAKQRRYPAALGSYEEALRIRHHVLGAAHPDTLRAAEQVRLLHVAHSPARA